MKALNSPREITLAAPRQRSRTMRRRRSRNAAFTLIEIMIVVNILTILFAMAVPSIKVARTQARLKSCISNLKKIQGAKEQWALENRKAVNATPVATDLFGSTSYLRSAPVCPENGGSYTLNAVDTNPLCPWGPTVHKL